MKPYGVKTSVLLSVCLCLACPVRAFAQSGDVVITSNTTWMAGNIQINSLTVNSGATLTVAGGSTINVTAGITVTGNSNIVLQGANTTAQVNGAWQGSGVTINAASVQVDSGSSINADGQGYVPNAGPGGASSGSSYGGSYGGLGGGVNVAPTYGSATAPTDLGSGGGNCCASGVAGSGGGAISLTVTGTLTDNGIISANGAGTTPQSGGGAGGSLYVTAGTLAGSGSFAADGGSGGSSGGGGGRIAILYTANSGFSLVNVTANGGSGTNAGAPGTVEALAANGNLTVSDNLVLPPNANLTFGAITINNEGSLTLGAGTILTAQSATVTGGGTFLIGGGSSVTVAAGVVVTGNSNIVLQAINTSAQVNGNWQGAGATLNAASVEVDAGSSINADGQGYAPNAGPGAASPGTSNGGSYGGLGGGTNAAPAYGSATAPTDLGSGGGNCCANGAGGSGGGAINLVVSGTLTNNGVVSANGMNPMATSGGGAGGSVYVTAGTLAGSGSFLSNGGSGGDNGGGGGRVAVYYGTAGSFTGFASSTATAGANGNPSATNGTVAFFNTSTSNSSLNVYQGFSIPAGTNVTYNSVSVPMGGVLTIGGGAQITVTGALTVGGTIVAQSANNSAQVSGTWQGTGVTINAGSVQVNANGAISADGQGYVPTAGPGGASSGSSNGGSYGGQGGGTNAAPIYGSPTAPTDLGSGGGNCCSGAGTSGGGAIRLAVSGTLTNNGVISANGMNTTEASGGGAGGSVYVTAGTLAGAGSFSANGGTGNGAGGGGGRIAVYYGANGSSFTGSTTALAGANGSPAASNGTAVFFDTSATNYNVTVYQTFPIAARANITYNSMTVPAGAVLTIGGGAQLTLSNALTVGGTVVAQSIDNTAAVNGVWQGTGVTMIAASVQVNPNGVINADGQGYVPNAGPGGASPGTSNGGTYGGLGGGTNVAQTYGSTTTPADLGSGGGYCCGGGGGPGGGAIRLLVTGTLTNNGTISANGAPDPGAGAGAGGSLDIIAGSLAGSGSFSANGGLGNNGGGGGRLAVYYAGSSSFNQGSFTAAGGQGSNSGSPGSVNVSSTQSLLWLQPAGSVLYGVETLQWFADFGASVNVTLAGPQTFTLLQGAPLSSSLAFDTTAVPNGRYELLLTDLDASGNTLQQQALTVVVNNSVVWHSGTLTANQEWTANQVQGLAGNVVVPAGVTLTIDPGTVVKALPGTEIIVQPGGILNASGTGALPIVFTTFDDSSIGGNTDFDAGISVPTPGEWQGVSVQSGGQFNSDSNTTFRYVGASLSGTLSTQTLQGTFIYTVSGTVVVPGGVTLTIQPGAILKFTANSGMSIQPGATLSAVGTAAQPIYFTSINDDSVGGDTNGNGGATLPASGDWGSIVIDGAQAQFVHVQMLYGSGPAAASVPDVVGMIETTDNATVTIADCLIGQGFWNGIQTGYPNGGGDTVTVTDTVIWAMGDRAINAWPGSIVHVVNDTVDGNSTGVMSHGGAIDVANTIVSNTKSTQWGGIGECCGGTVTPVLYNDVWTTVPGVANYFGIGDPTGTNGNISANPVFVNEPQGNFQLNYGSPAIDAANGTVPNYPLTDILGNARYNDPQVTNKTGIPDANGNYPDMGAYEFVATATSNIDFTVPAVTGPTSALVNSTVTIDWTVTNIGSGIAYGPWHDAVYLVQDPDTNPVAIFAGRFLEGVGAVLGPGASYHASATIIVPGATIGNQRWEVKTNVLGEVFEGQNTANNTGISLDPVVIDLTPLVVNGPAVSSSFAASGQSWWYKLNPAAGQNVSVNLNLNGGSGSGAVQLFIGQGYVPTPQNFDIQQVQWNSPTVAAVISNAANQTYYVTAYAQSLTASPAAFTLAASTLLFSLTSVQPGSAPNTGSATIAFVGGGFTSATTFQLVGPGGTVTPTSVFLVDEAHADVTFNVNGLKTGAYTPMATQNATIVKLNNGFTVTTATGTVNTNPIQVTLQTPSAFRTGFPAEVTLDYQNVSGVDQPAPLLQLTALGGTVTPAAPECKTGCSPNFAAQYQNTFTAGYVLGINQQGPAGVLPAGAGGSLNFQVIPGNGSNVTFGTQIDEPGTLIILGASGVVSAPANLLIGSKIYYPPLVGSVGTQGFIPGETIQVGTYASAVAFCNAMIPPNASPLGFTRPCMQLLVESGFQVLPTSGGQDSLVGSNLALLGLNEVLASDATALSQIGIYESNVAKLLAFEFQKDGFTQFNQRYHLGAFGFGTSHPYDITAGLTGTVPTVFYPDGSARSFGTPSPSQSNQFLGAVGDYGTLTGESDGSWLVTESNGWLYHLKTDPLPSTNQHHLLDYIQDLDGNRITVTYDNDLATNITDNFGNTTTYVYDSLGHITQATDPEGRVTTYTYDVVNAAQGSAFLTSITNSAGTTTITWNTGGSDGIGYLDDSCVTTYCEPAIGVTTIAFPDGTHTYYTYDTPGRLASQYRDNGAQKLTYTYGANGAVTVTDALGNATTAALTVQGSLGQLTDPLGNVTQYSYDLEGKLDHAVGPLGASGALAYDSSSNPISVRGPSGNSVSMSYGAHQSLQSMTDANGNVTSYGYDSSFDPTSVTFPDTSTGQATYDPYGNLLTLTNRRGHTTSYTYNQYNLVISKTYANGPQVQYSYDDHRNLQTVTTSAGTTTYSYDSADRLTGISYPNGQSIRYTYNSGGQRTSMSDSTGFTVNYSYDSAGRLSQLSSGSSSIVSYSYDSAGKLSQKALGNGTYITYTYDAAGNMLHLINHASNGATISEYDYTYDGMGRRVSMNSPAGAWTFAYDPTGQLTTVNMPGGSVQYTYDAAGNRTASSAANFLTNNLNEYTAAGANSYAYDADGNLISGGGWTYTYDDDNRLLSAVSATDNWSYQYDGLGNRISTTHNGTVTQHLNDASGFGNVEAEFTGSGQLIAHYTYGLDLVSSIPATGSPDYYHFDGSGNTVQTTNSSGSVVDSYTYLPFGEKLSSTGSVNNPFTYVGEFGVMDEGSGLYYMRNRWYNPPLGRFLQTDSSGLAGGDFNLYRYAGNSPLNLVDPTGEFTLLPDYISIGGGALGGYAALTVNSYTGEIYFSSGGTTAPVTLGVTGGHLSTPVDGDRGAAINSQLLGDSTTVSVNGGPVSVGANVSEPSGSSAGEVSLSLLPSDYLAPRPGANVTQTHTVDTGLNVNFQIVQNGWTGLDNLCNGCLFNDGPQSDSVPIPRSIDPNGKLTSGFATQGYIPPNIAIPYMIYFENQSTATAPAAKVVVTDPLPASLDWSTLQLNQIQFNNVTINVPPGLQTYSGQVNVSTDPNPVNVTAAINPSTGVLTWTMQSVDPSTGSLPANPLSGFLPPNTASNQGAGYVTFTVSPKAGMGNAAAITNQASIVFDTNAAIATNSVTNTIDATIPASAVTALPSTTTAASFTVSWSGSDPGGSGIAGYNIYYAIDGGPYAAWIPNATQTSGTFNAAVGHTYSFYSIAFNNVGTVQVTPGPVQTIAVAASSSYACAISGFGTATLHAVQSVINQALGIAAPANDLNGDAVVNVIDAQIAIQALLGNCPAQ